MRNPSLQNVICCRCPCAWHRQLDTMKASCKQRMVRSQVFVQRTTNPSSCGLLTELSVDLNTELAELVDGTLNLGGRSAAFTAATPLHGALPELDSMGVVSLIAALEERFGIAIEDGEIDGSVFQTFGTLVEFVTRKLDA